MSTEACRLRSNPHGKGNGADADNSNLVLWVNLSHEALYRTIIAIEPKPILGNARDIVLVAPL